MPFKKIIAHYRRRFIEALSSDLSPSKVALTFALAIPVGIVPFFCCFNICLSFLLAWRFKLNHVLMQVINNVLYPVQLLLFLPFMRLGVRLFSDDRVPFSPKLILASFSESKLGTIQLLGMWNLYAVLAWLLISVPVAGIVFYLSLILYKRKIRVKAVFVEVDGASSFGDELR
jgi:uncharacterized protein (DUF2062 family)